MVSRTRYGFGIYYIDASVGYQLKVKSAGQWREYPISSDLRAEELSDADAKAITDTWRYLRTLIPSGKALDVTTATRAMRMRTIAILASAVVIAGARAKAESADAAVVSVSAHQDFGLSLKHAWTAQLRGTQLTIDRPGKHRRVLRLKQSELEHLLHVVADSEFRSLSPRLGQTGSCDDCARCSIGIHTSDGFHTVERVATRDGAATLSQQDERFRAVWVAVKAIAGVSSTPDACW